MAALQILVLPVKVRILARQLEVEENLLLRVTGFFVVCFDFPASQAQALNRKS